MPNFDLQALDPDKPIIEKMASSTPDISVILLKLPKEINDAIYNYLENDDVKNLRVTCSAMAKLIPLSFDRVFISANSFNLKVFHAIA
jgi:hypothetical protein